MQRFLQGLRSGLAKEITMGISSAGIGSGLDVNSIVSQMVALEKRPIAQLQSSAASIQTKLST